MQSRWKLASLGLAAAWPSLSFAWAPTETLRISSADLSGDCTVRSSATINGTSPGPTLRFKEGDHIWIRVYNDMQHHNTTLHFHGLSQLGSPFADGTPQASQWPIAAGNYFDYEFQLTKGSAGTYMYHTHSDFQIVTAYGAFIIEDSAEPPYEYDEDLPIMFGDYYHRSDLNITAGLLGTPFVWLGEPQNLVINGDGLGDCNPENSRCTSTCHHHVLEVDPDKTYRVRAIGITALTFLYVAFEDHASLSLIEVDGAYISPTNTSRIQIHSGQRYSFLLRTKSEAELAALGKRTFWANVESRWRLVRDQGAFLLHYRSAGDCSPQVPESTVPRPANLNATLPLPGENAPWVDSLLKPLEGEDNDGDPLPPKEEVTRTITLSSHQLTANGRGSRWFVNDLSYDEKHPLVPYLVQAYENPQLLHPNYTLASENDGYDPSTGTYPIRTNETVEILLLNVGSDSNKTEAHPWHFHGQHPWLIEAGTVYENNTIINSTAFTPATPIRRDTFITYAGTGASYTNTKVANGTLSGYTKLRLKGLTPGIWLAHCHIQPHAILGMAVVFAVGLEDLPQLPGDFKAEYLTYNYFPPSLNQEPSSFFDIKLGSMDE